MLLSLLLPILVACGKPAIGEACETAGDTEACADGAVCTNLGGSSSDTAAENTCQATCTSQSDCDSGESCNGVSGTNVKTCQAE